MDQLFRVKLRSRDSFKRLVYSIDLNMWNKLLFVNKAVMINEAISGILLLHAQVNPFKP